MAFIRSTMAIGFLAFALGGCNSKTPDQSITNNKVSATSSTCSSDNGKATENTLLLQVKSGCVVIELSPEIAPEHVKRIATLANKGFYDGIVFHRVIDGFMAQTGDPTGTGRGGSDLPDLKAEFSSNPFARGVLGMARSQSPNSANSQFFIMLAQGDFLNGKYTVFGKVVEGMEHIDAIKKGDPNDNGAVSEPDKIISMKMAKN